MHAEKWLTRLFEAILSLGEFPACRPVIPEARELGYPVRHLLYGRGKGVYRIISPTYKIRQGLHRGAELEPDI
jgi:hypothetical protein